MIVKNYTGTMDKLVFNIGNLHYDVTAVVLEKIADNLIKRAIEINNLKLTDTAELIYETKQYIDAAWSICKDKMNGECSKHPRTIKGYKGTIDELAQDIVSNPDDDLKLFLHKLGTDFYRQGKADHGRGKKKLSTELYAAAITLYTIRV